MRLCIPSRAAPVVKLPNTILNHKVIQLLCSFLVPFERPRSCHSKYQNTSSVNLRWPLAAIIVSVSFALDTVPLSARVDRLEGSQSDLPAHYALYPHADAHSWRTQTTPRIKDHAALSTHMRASVWDRKQYTRTARKPIAPRRSRGKNSPKHPGYSGTLTKPHPLCSKGSKIGRVQTCNVAASAVCLLSMIRGTRQSSCHPRRRLRFTVSRRRFSFLGYIVSERK